MERSIEAVQCIRLPSAWNNLPDDSLEAGQLLQDRKRKETVVRSGWAGIHCQKEKEANKRPVCPAPAHPTAQ